VKINPKIINYLFVLGVALVLLVGIFCILYYFNFQKNECLRDPFVYGSKQIEEANNLEFSGWGSMFNQGNTLILYFDSNSSHWVIP